jgi:hypothetical protein
MCGETALVGLGGMSHKYKLSDIFARNLAGFGADRMDYRMNFMSHNMESKVRGWPGTPRGVCPFFFEPIGATSAKKIHNIFQGMGSQTFCYCQACAAATR